MINVISSSRLNVVISAFVTVHPHETSALLHSSSCFFFILSAYFVLLPLRDDGVISLGLSNLPGLFVGSLLLTLIAAPLSTLVFSLPHLSKCKVLQCVTRSIFHSMAFFVRIFAIHIGGSRLFGFIGAGATLGQLFGSLFATVMAWFGPFLLLFAALLMEFAAQSAIGMNQDASHDSRLPEELSPISWYSFTKVEKASMYSVLPFEKRICSLSGPTSTLYAKATHTIYGSSSAWNFHSTSEKVSVIAATVTSSVGRRRLFAQINSFIAVFVLAGQLTLTGRILTVAGVTTAISAAPFVAFLNFVAIAVWPTWVTVRVSEILRKVVTYVVTRPGRELLFTVVSQDEKYKAKLCIDVFIQKLGDATAAGMYKLLFSTLNGRTSTVSIYALPVCVLWIAAAFHLGHRQAQLSKFQTGSTS